MINVGKLFGGNYLFGKDWFGYSKEKRIKNYVKLVLGIINGSNNYYRDYNFSLVAL